MPTIPATNGASESCEDKLPQRTRDYLDHGAATGCRNDELFHAAGQFRDAGYLVDEAHGHLTGRAIADGLSEAEARTTINSAYAHQPRDPIGGNSAYGVNGATSFQSSTLKSQAQKEEEEPNPPPQPQPLPDPIPKGLVVMLETCFEPGERIGISDTTPNAAGEHKPGPGDVKTRESGWNKSPSNGSRRFIRITGTVFSSGSIR
jgi:hypothetical protein